jgi:hypothetical protein
VVQSTPSQQSGGKKKARNKPKKNNNNEQPKNQPQTPAAGKQPQWKPKFPCLICGDDHYTQDFPHRDEVAKIFKGNSQPAVLTQPFPQQQSLVAQTPTPGGSSNQSHDEASTSAHIYMFNGINLTTRTMTYDTPIKPDKPKPTNGSLPDPLPSSVSPPSASPRPGHFRSRNLHLTPSYTLLRALSKNLPLILVHRLPKTTTLLKIWLKHRVLCLLWKFYNTVPANVECS